MKYRNIVVLTGAGISAESGLSTFRDEGGLWAKHRIEDVATPEGFSRNPALVQGFYNARRAELTKCEPNGAHQALARLEREAGAHGGRVIVVTQNVDDLHERGGSQTVWHMHGELNKARCQRCGGVHDWHDDITDMAACAACAEVGALRPHVVWFGEIPFHLDDIEQALAEADLFISVGTSGNVYPAAGFVALVRRYGRAHTIEVNLEPSEGRTWFEEARHGPAGTLLPELVDEILEHTPSRRSF